VENAPTIYGGATCVVALVTSFVACTYRCNDTAFVYHVAVAVPVCIVGAVGAGIHTSYSRYICSNSVVNCIKMMVISHLCGLYLNIHKNIAQIFVLLEIITTFAIANRERWVLISYNSHGHTNYNSSLKKFSLT
jgi:hypothetical protein